MERNKYLLMCQKASFKTGYAGAWWSAKWNDDELVRWKNTKCIPIDYRFGFQKGNATHLAILHDMQANAIYTAKLSDVEPYQENFQKETKEGESN